MALLLSKARAGWLKRFFVACKPEVRYVQYRPRPLLEDPVKLKEAANACGVHMEQITLRPPATFVFDKTSVVPIRFQPRLAPPPVFCRDWWTTKAVHQDLARYNIYRVMEYIYEHVKVELGDEAAQLPEWFLDCRTGEAMLETYRILGSLSHYELGTCFVKRAAGTCVVVDEAVGRKVLVEEALERMELRPLSPKRPLRQTFSSVVTVPRAVYEADKDGLLREDLSRLVSDKSLGAKIAVEIDRRFLGLGNIILFASAEVAQDSNAVWDMVQQLDEGLLGCDLVGLKLVIQAGDVQGGFPCVYTIVPDFIDDDGPYKMYYEWAALTD